VSSEEDTLKIYRYIGELLGLRHPKYQTYACMNRYMAEVIAALTGYKFVCPEDTETIEYINKVVIPFLTELAIATWGPDILTEMAIKIARKAPKANVKEGLQKIFEGETNE